LKSALGEEIRKEFKLKKNKQHLLIITPQKEIAEQWRGHIKIKKIKAAIPKYLPTSLSEQEIDDLDEKIYQPEEVVLAPVEAIDNVVKASTKLTILHLWRGSKGFADWPKVLGKLG
jgi:hypothetical protein